MISKKEVFWELLDNYSPDVVVACETWLNQSIANNEFISPNYKMYRLDRNDGYGGIFISVKAILVVNLLNMVNLVRCVLSNCG